MSGAKLQQKSASCEAHATWAQPNTRDAAAQIRLMLMRAGYALEAAEELFLLSHDSAFDRAAGTLACAIGMVKQAEAGAERMETVQ